MQAESEQRTHIPNVAELGSHVMIGWRPNCHVTFGRRPDCSARHYDPSGGAARPAPGVTLRGRAPTCPLPPDMGIRVCRTACSRGT